MKTLSTWRTLATLALVSVVALAVVPRAEAVASVEETNRVLERFDELDAYYDANPELKTTPGSGWKPYNRLKWELQRRIQPDGTRYTEADRFRAWEVKRAHEAGLAPRSTTWFSLGPTNFAGRILAHDFDPTDANTVYAGGADGGVWKTTDQGTTWNPMSDELPNLAIGGLAVSKTNPNVVVIGTGEPTPGVGAVKGVGIFRSTDAGVTWLTTSMNTVPGNHGFHFMESGPDGTFLAGASDGLWRSDDDGANWVQVRPSGDYYDGKWKPDDANTVYVVKGNGPNGNNVKISTDNGVTWAKAGTGQPVSFLIGKSKIAVSAANPEVVYAFYSLFGTGASVTGLWRSIDGGSTWTAKNTDPNLVGGQTWYNLVCESDPNNASRVIVGGVRLKRSGNNGTTFFNADGGGLHVDHHSLAYAPGSDSDVWLGNDGGMWLSESDGAPSLWQNKNNGLVTYQFYDICVNNGPTSYYIMGGTQDNGTDKWSGTTVWTNGLGADGMVCNISASLGTVVLAEIQFGGHRKSTTSGSNGSFSPLNSGIVGSGAWVTPVDLDANDANHAYTATTTSVYRMTNGSSWVNVANRTANEIAISPVDGNVVWTSTGAVWYTTDDGGSWTQATTPPANGSTVDLVAHPTDANAVFVAQSAGGVALTTDLGATWTDVSGDLPTQPTNCMAVNPSNLDQWFVGTDLGVYMTTNAGVNWVSLGDGTLPNVEIYDMEIQYALQKLVVGTHGRGAWELDIASDGVSSPEVDVARSRNLMLDPPAPNPVTDRAMLRFAARHDGPVTISIYDIQGRLVIQLDEFERGDGVVRTTPWFTDDVPAGVYFAVLQAGTERASRKIVVTK